MCPISKVNWLGSFRPDWPWCGLCGACWDTHIGLTDTLAWSSSHPAASCLLHPARQTLIEVCNTSQVIRVSDTLHERWPGESILVPSLIGHTVSSAWADMVPGHTPLFIIHSSLISFKPCTFNSVFLATILSIYHCCKHLLLLQTLHYKLEWSMCSSEYKLRHYKWLYVQNRHSPKTSQRASLTWGFIKLISPRL